jgi:hypothetical protein
MKPTIEVIIAPTGEITIDALGFKGADCEQATRHLEQALGVAGPRVKKPEYHSATLAQTRQKLGA